MTQAPIGAELRKYRALAWALVITLFVSVALFVQFMRMDRLRTMNSFSSSAEHTMTTGGQRISQLIERLETIGREHLLLGASDAQLRQLIQALQVDKTLVSLCVIQGSTVRVVLTESGASTATGAGCVTAFSSSQTLVSYADNSLVTDLRIIPSADGDEPLLGVRVRDSGTRELRATLSSSALVNALLLDSAGQITDSGTVCLSLRVDGSFHELACHVGGVTSGINDALPATDANVMRLIETAGLQWRVVVSPHLQLLAGTITLLPFTMFAVALIIGATACVFAFQTTDKNMRIEAHADELRLQLEQLGKLEEQNHLLDQFAAMAAHDLQAPLRFIVSNAHLLIAELESLDQPALSRMALTQVEQGMRMRALVVDLLEFCRAGQGKLTTAPVDTRALVNEEIRLLKSYEHYADTHIVVGSLPDALICDAEKLAHIIRNLLENAVKFSQQSSCPEVSISASRQMIHGPWTFRIKDNGPGISEQYRELIFRPFSRLDTHTSGTGMGLAIVKVMLERHGGTIYIDSSDSGGSTFCFTMPGALSARTPE